MRGTIFAAGLVCVLIWGAVLGCLPDNEQKEPYAGNDTGPRIAATCEHTVNSEDDPIFEPTTKPPMHPHQFFGPLKVNNSLTGASLQEIDTTCKQPNDHSAWWRPEVYWGDAALRAPAKLVVYFEVTDGISAEQIRPFPAGFEAVSRTPTFRCGNGDWSKTAPERCGADTIQIRTVYGSCLDSDNKTVEANLRFANRGKCPDGFDLLVPAIQSTGTYRLPDASGPLKVAGNTGISEASSMHEDFINGWNQDALRQKVALCLRQTNREDPRPDECRTSDNR